MFTEDDITQCMKDYSLTRAEAIAFLSRARRNDVDDGGSTFIDLLSAAGVEAASESNYSPDYGMDFLGGGGDFGGGGSGAGGDW